MQQLLTIKYIFCTVFLQAQKLGSGLLENMCFLECPNRFLRMKFSSILHALMVINLLSYWLTLEAAQFHFLEQRQLKTKVPCIVP